MDQRLRGRKGDRNSTHVLTEDSLESVEPQLCCESFSSRSEEVVLNDDSDGSNNRDLFYDVRSVDSR
jgi:hypothetical protein